MSSQNHFLDHEELYAGFNKTELLQVCHEVGLRVHPATSHEDLVAYLLGRRNYAEARRNDIDAWRHGIMGFLLDHWDVVSTQLKCPASSGDPLSCFQCVDTQVMHCLAAQSTHLVQIRNHKKEEEGIPMAETISIATVPRDAEKIAAINFIQLRRVVSELEQAGIKFESVEESRAFYGLKDATERAKKILSLLLRYDEANPGTEDEQAVAPAPAAKATRNPATKSTRTPPKSAEATPAGGGATQVVDLGPLLELIEGLHAKMDAQAAEIQELKDNVIAVGKLTEYSVGVTVTMAEATLQEPIDNFAADIAQASANAYEAATSAGK